MCLDVRGRAILLDAQGQRKEEVAMGPTSTRVVQYLRAADLNADGKPEYCGVAQKELGDYTVLGLDAAGRELWSYPLPKGHPQVPVEWLVPGNVSATGPGQWLVPAADGSLHILGADGKPVDRFNYGAVISGVGSFRRGGKALLLIASPQSIEALEVQ